MPDHLGQQLGNYRLINLLGQGGFARVYLGEHVYLNTTAAIKVLLAQLSSDDAEYFLNEARTIARLVHPNIVRVLEFDVRESTPFLVVDYAPNGTLRKLYPRGSRLPLLTIVNYVKQLADALQYAHDMHIIHRDVKPENMLLGRRHEVLLSDFGIAVVTQSVRYQSTQSLQEVAGTIAYMAPEQIQSQASPLSDQYSLAVAVYEWLAGERPFHGSFAEVAIKHTLVPPPSLVSYGISKGVDEVMMRALAKDPAQRFPRVTAFAEALEQAYLQDPGTQTVVIKPASTSDQPDSSGETLLLVQEQEGKIIGVGRHDTPTAIKPTPVPPWPPTTSLLSKQKLPISESLIDTAIIEQTDASTPRDPSTTLEIPGPAEPLTPVPPISEPIPPVGNKPRTRIRRRTLLGLGGAALALAAGGGIWTLEERLRNVGTIGTPTATGSQTPPLFVYQGHTAQVWSVAWSPDGRYVASAGSDHTVQVWDASDGTHQFTYSGHTDTVYGIVWSPDSKRMASVSYDGGVQSWDALTGYYPREYRGHSSYVWSVTWSPDSKYLATGGADSVIRVWDEERRKAIMLYHGHTQAIHAVSWSPDNQFVASAASDGTVQVWSASSGIPQTIFRPYNTIAWSVSWSPDGKRVACACENKTVQLFDTAGGDHLYTYYGHTDFVYAVAWSPDGKKIASGGDDKVVQVWDPSNSNLFNSFSGHTAPIRSLAWSPISQRLASASWDKTVQVWKI